MAHMGCKCGNSMWDGTGEIVYDIFSINDLKKHLKDNIYKYKLDDVFDKFPYIIEDNPYFWLCDKCKRVHLWSNKPEYCKRTFELCDNFDKVDINKIKELSEFLVVNINDYGLVEEEYVSDLIKRNPINSYKYYITDDLTKVYIINTEENTLDRVYELTYESTVEYCVDIESFDNLLISTIYKKNNGHEYIVENGIRKQQDTDDYPHKQVNFMVVDNVNNDSKIYFNDSNKQPEVYTTKTMDQFNKKYAKLLHKKYKYYYVEYLDMVGDKLYCYKSNEDYQIGDIVIVPRGFDNHKTEAKIINIKYYDKDNTPYSYDDLKEIIKLK